MPSSATTQSKHRLGTARSAVEASAVRLCESVRHLVQEPPGLDVDEWEEQLLCLVDECIESGNDDVLAAALDKCAEEERAFEQLLFHIEDAAANPIVNVDDKLVDARLIAIPILLTSRSDVRGGRFERSANFEALCHSTERAGLIGPRGSVVFMNYLYHSRELSELPPSRVSHLAQGILDARTGKERVSRTTLGQRGWPSQGKVPKGASMVMLCYLLAVVLDDPKATRIPAGTSETEAARRRAHAEQWREIADPLVAGALDMENGAAHVLGFEPFHEGLRRGLTSYLDMNLHCELAGALVARGMQPKALSVVISAHGDKSCVSEVHVSASSRLDGALILGHVLPVDGLDDALEAFTRIGHCLNAVGVEEVAIVSEVQPLHADDDSGERVFLATKVVEADTGDAPMPEGQGARRFH